MANENAKIDNNNIKTMLWVDIDWEIVNIKTDTNWNLLTKWINDLTLIDNIKNWYSDKTFWFVFWKRTTNVQNAVVDLWDWPTATYVFPTVAQQMRVISSNANDTAWWTWCRKVHIHYLDNNYLIKDEIVTLNWTTPVNMVANDVFRINYVHSAEVWSNWVPLWNISVQNTAWTVTYSVIQTWFNVARQAIYTVPDWVNWYITHWQASSWSTAWNHFTQITLRATQHLWEAYPWVFLIIDEVWNSDWWDNINFPIPIRIPARTDVKISAISDTNNANVTALWAIMWYFETI